ncbi:MAG: FG-GAP-like repeat-containing protein, partial [Candidatus Latescibacterota bacterium]
MGGGGRLSQALGFVLVLLLGRGAAAATEPQVGPRPTGANLLAGLPLSFEPNLGQGDTQARFLSRGRGYSLILTPDGATLWLSPGSGAGERGDLLSLHLVGAAPALDPAGEDLLPGTSNYLLGDDPARWSTQVPNYARVRYRHVYPGIDLVYYGAGGRTLEHDFEVAPGADPASIGLRFDGQESLRLDADGNLVVALAAGEVLLHRPVAYQEARGRRRAVESRYVLASDREVGFEVGPFDREVSLVIDPILTYASYLGGSGGDMALGIAVDAAGCLYLTGFAGTAFPVSSAYDSSFGGVASDAFVTKLDPSGSSVVYSTFLGGSADDQGLEIAVDAAGQALLVGYTASTDWPVSSAHQGTYGGGSRDAFVAKLSASGSSLVYSTYLGSTGYDQGYSIDVDGAGNAWVVGEGGPGFPTVSPLYLHAGASDAFVAALDPGGALLFSTLLGGTGADNALQVSVGGNGQVYVGGTTSSTSFPVLNAYQGTPGGGIDGFLTAINPSGPALVFSTYFGGNGEDNCKVVRGADGSLYVVGHTTSTNRPTVDPLQASLGGSSDLYFAKLSSDASGLLYATYLGGTGAEYTGDSGALAAGADGSVHVAGWTASASFPTLAPSLQADHRSPGNYDGLLLTFAGSGPTLLRSTFYGGSGNDHLRAVAVDPRGNVYLAGSTVSSDLNTAGGIQGSAGGSWDALLLKVGVPTLTAVSPARGAESASRSGDITVTFSTAMAAGTQGTFAVHGSQTGRLPGTYSGPGTTLTFDPAADLRPGEAVEVTLTGGLEAQSGPPNTPQVWRFTAAAGAGPGQFNVQRRAFGTGSDRSVAAALADIDGDTDLDVVVANGILANEPNGVYFNDGSGNFTAGATFGGSPINYGYALVLADMDNDGDPDAVVGDYQHQNAVYLNNGSGSFNAGTRNFGTGTDPTRGLAAGDLDGDGDLDLAVANETAQNVVYLNNGTGSVTAGTRNFGTGSHWTIGLALGDVDGDGDLDIAAGNYNGQNVVYLNDGAAHFTAGTRNFGTGTDQTFSVALGDVDGDGDLDLAVGNTGQNTVWVNDGAGTFTYGSNFGTGTDPTYSVAFGEADGDGDLDLAAGNYSEPSRVYANDGSGVFTLLSAVGTVGESTQGVAWGDVDGDGDLDLALANGGVGLGAPNAVCLNQAAPPAFVVTTPAATVSSVQTVAPGEEVLVFSVGITGNGTDAVESVTFSLDDLSGGSGLDLDDVAELRLYRNTAANLNGADPIGTQTTVSLSPASTTVLADVADVPPSGVERFYLVAAVLDTVVTDGASFRVGFGSGGIGTTAGPLGTGFAANDLKAILTDVPAEQLVFTTEPVPLSVPNGVAFDFTTDPVVEAWDHYGNRDADFVTALTVVKEHVGGMDGTATFTNGTAVPLAGVATFTGLGITYTGQVGDAFLLKVSTPGLEDFPARSQNLAVTSQVTWDGGGDGSTWGSAANWSGDAVPGSTSSVVIGPAYTVAVSSSAAATSVACSGTLVLAAGGSLNVSDASDVANLSITGGTLTGAGDVTVGTALTWSSGTMSGTGVTVVGVGASAGIAGSSAKYLGRTLWNQGTATVTGPYLRLANGTIVNDGTLDLQGGNGVEHWTGANLLDNYGVLRKSGGGTSPVGVPVRNNDATLQVTAMGGTLQLTAADTLAGGTLDVAAGGVLELATATRRISGLLTGNIAGTVRLVSGTLETPPEGATLDLDGTGFQWQGGSTVSCVGILHNAGVFEVNGTGAQYLQSGILLNEPSGSVVLTAPYLRLQNGGQVLNRGTFDVQADVGLAHWTGTGTRVTNEGVFRKSAGSGQSEVDVPFDNVDATGEMPPGRVEAQVGVLSLASGGTHTGSLFTASTGATVDFGGGTHAFDGVSVEGLGRGQLSDGEIQVISASSVGNLDLTGGTLSGGGVLTYQGTGSWSAGTQSGSGETALASGATLTLTGGSSKFLQERTLHVLPGGTLAVAGPYFRFVSGGHLVNEGLLDVQGNLGIEQYSGAVGLIRNTGTLTKSAGTGTATLGVPVKNQGGTIAVAAGAGTLQLAGADTLHGGSYAAGTGATLELANSTHRVLGTLTGSIEGHLRLASGVLEADPDSGAFLALTGNGLEWSGESTVRCLGPLENQGLLQINGTSGSRYLAGPAALANAGVGLIDGKGLIELTAPYFRLLGNSAVTNAGVLDILGNVGVAQWTAPTLFTNTGTFRKSGGTGTSTVSVPFDNQHTDSVEALTGVLSFTGGGTHT